MVYFPALNMAAALTEEQVDELKDAFSLFDKDGDGSIDYDELRTVMTSLGHNLTTTELQEMIDEVDSDGNGKIEFSEFITMMTQKIKTCSYHNEVLQVFKILDKDGSGSISEVELREVMASIGEDVTDEEIREMIHEADTDGSGQVNFKQFASIVQFK